jgi:hypothetical protein
VRSNEPGSLGRPHDTSDAAHARQNALYRGMSGGERVAIAFRLNALARRAAEAGIRARHPDYSEEQVEMASRRLRLGDELTLLAWPDRELVDP